jgi:tyrosine-specific transport protein
LRAYFYDDIPGLTRVVFWGSLIPLICYLAWNAIILGSIPLNGPEGLLKLAHDPHATSGLAHVLSNAIQRTEIHVLFQVFISVCMLTAFLGVSLCLMSFLSDGLKLALHGSQGMLVWVFTFLPPWMIVMYCPGVYLHALAYAGSCCVVLLLLLPGLMSYFGRKRFQSSFHVPGGRYTQWGLLVSSSLIFVMSMMPVIKGIFA